MNLAIVIGINKYSNFNNIPQCKNDAKIINDLLVNSSKYDDVLYISKNTTSGNIFNNEIDNFIKKHENDTINEVLFYFSGHGITKEKEFYYCTSNTDKDRINATSIPNNNLDSIIRQLNPNLYVKVIDACESGLAYVKGNSNREEILQKEKGMFKNCYFFSSSSSNNDSFVQKDQKYSDFTYGFINIIRNKLNDEKKEIKYRDMSNELSDYFAGKEQIPFFVQQGGLSEIFLPYKEELLEILNKDLENNTIEQEVETEKIEDVTEEIAIAFKEKIISSLENKLKRYSDTLKDNKYQIRVSYEEDGAIPRNKICNWIKENKEKCFVFANPKTRTILKQSGMFKIFKDDDDYEYRTDEFEVNVDKDNYQVKCEYTSQKSAFPNIKCHIIILYSLTKIYLFYTFATSVPESWTRYADYKSDETVKYKVFNIENGTSYDEGIKEISDEFKNYADSFINKYIDALI